MKLDDAPGFVFNGLGTKVENDGIGLPVPNTDLRAENLQGKMAGDGNDDIKNLNTGFTPIVSILLQPFIVMDVYVHQVTSRL